jgi:type III pantothenate kinase
MILVFDVGNTNMVLGVYQGEKLAEYWRITTYPQRTDDEYGMLLRSLFDNSSIAMQEVKSLVIASVVPPLMLALENMSKKYFGISPLVVGPGVKTGISIKYENPREVGADRIVNAVAGYELYGGPLIIVDFGTATTFCVISARGEYLGGAIAPGIGISTDALFSRAAKLPRVELVKPSSVIGKNTISSMQSGIIYGFAGQVDAIVNRIKREMQADPLVIATGGLAELISRESETINKVDSLLTLTGLRLIHERNS